MKKILVSLILAVCMITVLIAGCTDAPAETVSETTQTEEQPIAEDAIVSDAETPTEEPKRVGVVMYYLGDEWCKGIADEFKAQGEALGYEMNIQDGNANNETQQKQIENFIAQQYDMIVVEPVDSTSIATVLEKAYAANIPVLGFDVPVDWDKLVSFVAWDNAEVGTLAGEYIKTYIQENLDDKDVVNVAILTMHLPHIKVREEAFRAVMDTLGDKVEIISAQDCQGNREVAANIISNIKEPIDIVWACVDNGAWGAVAALEAQGVEGAKVVTSDVYSEDSFKALKDNHVYYMAGVAVPPHDVVKDCMDILVKYFNGDTDDIPATKDLAELKIYDTNNIGEIYTELVPE